MTGDAAQRWIDANQRYLLACLAAVRAHIERRVATPLSGAGKPRDPDEGALGAARVAMEQAGQALGRPAPLDVLCGVFGLSGFERDLLLLCAGVELDQDIAAACTALQGDPAPSFGLALMALPGASWGPLAPDAPLRRWHLVEVGPGNTLSARRLRIDEYVLHFLLGLHGMDERLTGLLAPVPVPGALPPSQQAAADRIARLWSGAAGAPAVSPAICLCSPVPAAMRAVAARACAQHELNLFAMRAADLPETPGEQTTAARLWERHAALTGSALLLEIDADAARTKAAAFAGRVRGSILLATADPMRLRSRAVARVDVAKPLPAEQRGLWQQALGALAGGAGARGDDIDAVATQFHFGSDDIAAVAARVGALASAGDGPEAGGDGLRDALWDACRVQARPKLDDLAQAIEPRATWDDLVLGDWQQRMLRDVAIHVRQRTRVYETWGFGSRSARGLGISALFAGPSGTGKTTAAEVLARELALDLYRIDLSAVVSKYIGETEKNLRRVFDAAEDGGVILLFDEADALFGKRSEIKNSHDRYANMEVSYLLQRIEAYRGLAILTTNLRDALDSAFLRRIRFVVEFAFPSVEQRRTIWTRMFPADAPTRDLDMGKLARLNLSGGSIRNVALGGAFLAAEEGAPIQMRHLQEAARSELAKLERPAPERELKEWI